MVHIRKRFPSCLRAYPPTRRPSRREMLAALAAMGLASLAEGLAQAPCDGGPPLGERLETLPLGRAGWARQPFGVKFGGPGLDARLVTDLSQLRADALVTPTEKVYVRTECPAAAADAARQKAWTIAIGGGPASASLSIEDLRRRARPMGTHLLECAGNNNPTNFGLMSVAAWDGVPLTDILPDLMRAAPSTAAPPTGLLVSGFDHDGQQSKISTPGASWILPLASLDRLGAFLAVRMNGEALPLDHGRPVRLVVPRWYGCAWIKWVHELRLVGADEPATSQMREFAGRTHQTRRHDLARDYTAPEIEAAAMPIRVDKWRGPLGITYLITGIVWGGTRPVERLHIRFSTGDSWKPFSVCPTPATAAIWSLWTYPWRPDRPGQYEIALRIPDTSVPQRRLDASYYVRQINIEQV
jgi:DMSO/TMAO reductase YedYZ molybdopterin-dependent catalytic subunit